MKISLEIIERWNTNLAFSHGDGEKEKQRCLLWAKNLDSIKIISGLYDIFMKDQ